MTTETPLPPFIPIPEDRLVNPTELSKDESDTLGMLSGAALDGLSLTSLAMITADEIFGDQIDKDDESLFLAAMIDETQPLQSELVAKLHTMFDMSGLVEPDRYSYQLFKRKAGFTARDKRLPKSVTRDPKEEAEPDLSELGQFCVAVCLREYQVVNFASEEHLLSQGMLSPVFEIKPHPEEKRAKPADRPSVPKNRTRVRLGQGKATIKSRKYMSILVWAFWDHNPVKENNKNNKKTDTSPLQDVIDKLKNTVVDRETHSSEPIPEKGITIYDSMDEATKAEGANIIVPEDVKWARIQEALIKDFHPQLRETTVPTMFRKRN